MAACTAATEVTEAAALTGEKATVRAAEAAAESATHRIPQTRTAVAAERVATGGKRGTAERHATLEGCQSHHIISHTNKHTRNHQLWELSGVSPNDRINRMLLPTTEGAEMHNTSRSIHQGRHVGSVNKSLGRKMDEVVEMGMQQGWTQSRYRAELENIIREERSALRSGERRLNKNYRDIAQGDPGTSGDPA